MMKYFKLLLRKIRCYLLMGEDVHNYPVIHHFPNMGSNGEVTVDCVICPAATSDGNYVFANQDSYGRGQRITPHCVGAVFVELDEYGLTLRWQPGEKLNNSFLSPFGSAPPTKQTTKPTEQGGHDGDI